jgi:hypothetical protein
MPILRRYPAALAAAAMILVLALLTIGGTLTPVAATPASQVTGDVESADWAVFGPSLVTVAATAVAPSSLQGRDPRVTRTWPGGEFYVTADVSTTGTLTTTFQTSLDGTNWTNLNQVNPQGTVVPVRVVQTADGTAYVSIPFAGPYTRPVIEASADITASVRVNPRQPWTEADE